MQSRYCRWLWSCLYQLVQNWSLARIPKEREYLGDKDKQLSLLALKHSKSMIGCVWKAPAHIFPFAAILQFPCCEQRTAALYSTDSPGSWLLLQHLPRNLVTSYMQPNQGSTGSWLVFHGAQARMYLMLFKNTFKNNFLIYSPLKQRFKYKWEQFHHSFPNDKHYACSAQAFENRLSMVPKITTSRTIKHCWTEETLKIQELCAYVFAQTYVSAQTTAQTSCSLFRFV